MVALLAVNTPGFPVPRANLVASAVGGEDEEVTALVSAGALSSEFACCEDCAKKEKEADDMDEDDTQEMSAEGCGCGKPKPPTPKTAEFEAELARLDLTLLDSQVFSKEWDGRCFSGQYRSLNPEACAGPAAHAAKKMANKAIAKALKKKTK